MKIATLAVLATACVCSSCGTTAVVVHDPLAKQTEAEYREIAARHAAYGNSSASKEWNALADSTAKNADARGGWLERLLDTLFYGVVNSSKPITK